MEKHLPNFLVLGTAKAGTSSLYAYLKKHPDIYLTPITELIFFAHPGRDLNFCGPGDLKYIWYDSLVATCEDFCAELKGQRPAVVWLTGLSGAGKSTIANIIVRTLAGRHCYILDGDNIRHGVNKDLGFTAADRVENIRRVADIARLLADAALIVIASLISPFIGERAMARGIVADIDFLEVFVDAPLAVCEARPQRGFMRKLGPARSSISPEIDAPPSKHHQRPIYRYRQRVPHLTSWLRRFAPSCGSAVFSDYNRIGARTYKLRCCG